MNISQLKNVLAVAGSSSMRAAASRLFISQPALSASIKELEDEVGFLIFERTNKGISLTEPGREFVSEAKQVLSRFRLLEERYCRRDEDRAHFCVSTQHYTFAIRAFCDLIKRHQPPRYVFAIHETRTRNVLEEVRSGRSEVGVLSFSAANEELLKKLIREYGLEFTPLMRRDTYAYVWADHELAGRQEIALSELADYPCVSFDQSDDSDFYLTEEAMADYEFRKWIKSDDRATSMEIIADLHGYAIGSGMLSGEDVILEGLVAIKLREEDPLTIGYIVKRERPLSSWGADYVAELQHYREPPFAPAGI